MKGEIYTATAVVRRAMGQKVHVLDLRDDAETDSLNLLDLMDRGGTTSAPWRAASARNSFSAAQMKRDTFWNDWSEAMIAGATVWLLADRPAEERRLSTLFDLFNNDDVAYAVAVLLDQEDKVRTVQAKRPLHLSCNYERETLPGVLGTEQTHLRLFDRELTMTQRKKPVRNAHAHALWRNQRRVSDSHHSFSLSPCGLSGKTWRRFRSTARSQHLVIIGSVSAEEIMRMPKNHQMLLIESEMLECRQIRYYDDREIFEPAKS